MIRLARIVFRLVTVYQRARIRFTLWRLERVVAARRRVSS